MSVPGGEHRAQQREARPEPVRSASALALCPSRQKLIIVGNGMVGHHFRKCALARGLSQQYDIRIFGEEAHAAYDRVRLGQLLQGGALEQLLLDGSAPAGDEPAAHTGSRVVAIDREGREVELADGSRHAYDLLVLATGARPVLPNLPGAELERVVVYRAAEDALGIRREALACAERGETVLVAGAGLLGLELAEQLTELGARVAVVESAAHLLPRQLDQQAADLLRGVLERQGVAFTLNRRVAAIEKGTPEGLVARLSGGESIAAGLVVFAIGVRPRDELARAAGVTCDLFGGVVIDDRLGTSDSRIFAIGDCARFEGNSYGLVAPGYDMAEVLVARLLGESSRFEGAKPATRLKTKTVEVFSIGESAVEGPDLRGVVCRSPASYRRLSVRKGRIVGASAVGAWSEVALAQQAVARQLPLGRSEEKRFIASQPVWAARASVSLELWPDSAPVCSCTGVTSGALKRAFAQGHQTVEALMECTRASTVCGSCRPLLESLVTPAQPEARPAGNRALLWTSAFGALLVATWFLAPPIPYSNSVRGAGYDALWREPWLRQLTGFSLATLLALGSLFPLRKRWPAFRRGSYQGWRLFHTLASLAAASLAVAHTGFRLGANFNALLMVTFLLCSASGALSGFAAAFESALPPGTGQRLRAWANRLHLYLAWPLPVLITFHVLKFYYF